MALLFLSASITSATALFFVSVRSSLTKVVGSGDDTTVRLKKTIMIELALLIKRKIMEDRTLFTTAVEAQ